MKRTTIPTLPLAPSTCTLPNQREVYVKINAGGFTKVALPELVQKTYRQALSTLRALGLQEGDVKYVEYMAKDVVLEVKQNGKTLKTGDKILKSSKIDFVLGDGKTGFQDQEMDSINASEKLAPVPAEENAQ